MAEESPYKPFYSVLILAFFCSLMVAGAAVGLRPLQEENKLLDRKKNILRAAGLWESNTSIEQMFANIETRIVELDTGKFVSQDKISPGQYDQRQAAMNSDLSESLSDAEDLAGIGRVEQYSLVYLVKNNEDISQIVLPVRGKGLWSTMYGYIALKDDFTTVSGISFYEHGETPGLGGEIENPRWQAGWQDKKIYNQENIVAITIGKGKGEQDKSYHVDGISGATLTSKGVDNLVDFWFGENGFKPFLTRLRENGGKING